MSILQIPKAQKGGRAKSHKRKNAKLLQKIVV